MVLDEKEDFPDISSVPAVFLDLKQEFSKSQASSLSPHNPSNCAIDLQPDTSPSRGCIYPLFISERKVIDEYSLVHKYLNREVFIILVLYITVQKYRLLALIQSLNKNIAKSFAGNDCLKS